MPGVSFLYLFNRIDIHTFAFYTDPGSGALVWQLLVASFFGIMFYVRSFIRKITATMSNRKNREESNQQEAVDRDATITPNRNRLK
jgi:hypothetical protein